LRGSGIASIDFLKPLTRQSTVWDAWNRPTAVTSTTTVGGGFLTLNLGSYEYNGLLWRTAKNTRVPRTETTGYSGERRVYTYDASWRLLQEDVDDDFTNNPGYNTRVQHAWGLRYIDDAVEQRRGTYAGSSAAPGDAVSYDKEYFHLTDVQYSTTALVDNAGTLKERVQYAAALAHPLGRTPSSRRVPGPAPPARTPSTAPAP
jgi:hypothetical protein